MRTRVKLYIHVGQATHFLEWEKIEFEKYFDLVDKPSKEAVLLAFGPDVLKEASELPAKLRFATLFPGFGHNPVYNLKVKKMHRSLIQKYYRLAFINPGPLQIAYEGLNNIVLYQFSVDVNKVEYLGPRRRVRKLIHISSDYPQKDWERSLDVMQRTGLSWEVYPPRDASFYETENRRVVKQNKLRKMIGLKEHKIMPQGYVDHKTIIKKYQNSDGFVHVARDIKSQLYLDGKYTASLIEAGLTGAILFWHDTFGLGNNLKTVFDIPLDPGEAAAEINRIISKLDVKKHSRATHDEMLATFNPESSVLTRVKAMLEEYNKLYG